MAFYVAFYSYKGGVGRSLALANAAYSLAARGKKVVLVDMDLEAPGLPEFKEFAIRGKSPKGFVEYATHYRQTGRCPALKGYVHACKESPGTGKLWLMPAGAVGGAYQKQLADLPWRKLHPQKGTLPFLETFKKALDEDYQPDYVLIDSRTGLSDIGGLSTHQLADLVVLVFNLTRSCLEGSIRTYRSFVSSTSKARFLQLVASPVPSLPPAPDSPVERQLAYAREHMPVGVAYGRTILRIDYNPAMALSEELAVRKPEVFPAAAERYEALREAIQRSNPEEVFSVLEQIRELRSGGHFEEGLSVLRSFTETHPKNAEGHFELGSLLFESGRVQDAIPAFQTARDLAPGLPMMHRRLGEALVAAGRFDDALTPLQKAEELGDRGRETYQALARVYSERRETAQETEARRKAILAILPRPYSGKAARLSSQQLQELRLEFTEVLGRRPPFSSFQPEAFWDLVMGSLSLSLKDKVEILRSILAGTLEPSRITTVSRSLQDETETWVTRLGPLSRDLQQRLAEEAADPKDSEDLLKLRKGDRVDAALLTFLAECENPPSARAIALLEEALLHDPENGYTFSELGAVTGIVASSIDDAEEKRKLLERSQASLEMAVRFKGTELDRDFYNWGTTLGKLADLAKGQDKQKLLLDACSKYEEALRHKPDLNKAFYNWGIALGKLADLAEGQDKQKLLREACSKCEEALRHKPDKHEALINWASDLLKLAYLVDADDRSALLHEAAEKARRASEIQAGSGDYNLACALSLLGEIDEAARLIASELERSPSMRSHALADSDLTPLWEARPDLRASIAASLESEP